MSIPKLAPLKAGDTLSYAGLCRLPPGTWAASCQVRATDASRSLIGTVLVTLGVAVDGDTPIALHADASQTQDWPSNATHALDIRYVDATGLVLHSPTMLLPVQQCVTGP